MSYPPTIQSFFSSFPLVDGEVFLQYIPASQITLYEDEWYIIDSQAFLITTNFRIGVACTDEELTHHWYSVTDMTGIRRYQEYHRLLLLFDESYLAFQFEKVDSLFSAYNALLELRTHRIREVALEPLSRTMTSLMSGNVSEAFFYLKDFREKEPFHLAYSLLSILGLRYQGETSRYIDLMITEYFELEESFPFFFHSTFSSSRFSRAQLFRFKEVFSYAEWRADKLHPGGCLSMIMIFLREGKSEHIHSYLESLLSSEQPVILMVLLFYLLEMLTLHEYPVLQSLLKRELKRIKSLIFSSEELETRKKEIVSQLFEEVLIILDFEKRPISAMETMERVSFLLQEFSGKKENQIESVCRFREDWRGLLEKVTPVTTEFSNELWNQIAFSHSAFHQVFEQLEEQVQHPKPDKIWALLRLNRVEEAWLEVSSTPKTWLKYWRSINHGQTVSVWMAGLATIELLIRKTGFAQSKAIMEELEEAYRYSLPGIKQMGDPMLFFGAELYGFYRAICLEKTAETEAYMLLLQDTDCGFEWTYDLVQTLLPAAIDRGSISPTVLPTYLKQFEHWFQEMQNSTAIRASESVEHAWFQLQEARENNALRVVITGETSAGKSSFINALLGFDILYITQREATAIQTQIYRGYSWRVEAYRPNGVLFDALEFGTSLNSETKERMQRFLKKYTSLDSIHSKQTGWVNVQCPVPSLPSGIIFLDTPGLNAHGQRTEIAEQTVETSHACIYLFDGRNALKGGESRAVRQFSQAVGKTLFVLNKMDLVAEADDDLDCDDENAAEAVIERVQTQLCQQFGVQPDALGLFAVSSLSPQRLNDPEARHYALQIPIVRDSLHKTLTRSKERLLARASAKVALSVARASQEELKHLTLKEEREILALTYQMPDDPQGFRDEVFLYVKQHYWTALQEQYINEIIQFIGSGVDEFYDRIRKGLQSCENQDQIKVFLKNRLGDYFRRYSEKILEERKILWRKSVRQMEKYFSEYLTNLYEDLPFQVGAFRVNFYQLQTAPVPLGEMETLHQRIAGKFSDAQAAGWGGAAAGAAVGALFGGPVGAFIGGWAGGWLGQQFGNDMIEEAFGLIDQEFNEYKQRLVEILARDVEEGENGEPPELWLALSEGIEEERCRFEALMLQRLHELQSKREQVFRKSGIYRQQLVEAMKWSNLLENLPHSTFR